MSSNTASGVQGRAFGLAPRRAIFALLAALALAAAALALSGALGGSGASSTRAHGTTNPLFAPTSSAKYGGLPSFLPKPKIQINRIVTATATHPALAIQGDSVNVVVSNDHVLATAVGPEVPEEGKFPVPPTSPCTFILTFSSATGPIPLNPATFTLVDELGHVHRPRVSAINGGAPPRVIEPGKPTSVKLYSVLATGDGSLSWAPSAVKPTVTWDYTVEID
jgi:hypothetical protein